MASRGNQNYDRIKSILDRLLTCEYNLKREMFLFKKLYARYPDFDFFNQFTTKKTTNSLAWFLSKWGDDEIRRDWNNYLNSKTQKPKEPDFDLGFEESLDIQQNPNTIKRKPLIDLLG